MIISKSMPLLLGSASPRRRALLEGVSLPLDVRPADVPELREPGEPVERFLARVVGDKLQAVARASRDRDAAAVLVADTVVVIGDDVLGKPRDRDDAVRLLSLIVGRTHAVHTRYAIAPGDDKTRARVERTVKTRVTLRSQSKTQIERYAATGEGLDKAGAYAVQGIGAYLVESLEGSYTNVVGLPLCEVVQDLEAQGFLGPFP